AINNDSIKMVQLLLDYNADLEQRDIYYDNAFIKACRKPSYTMMNFLLTKDKTSNMINSLNRSNETVLFDAIREGNVQLTKYLLEKNIKFQLKNTSGNTAFDTGLDELQSMIIKSIQVFRFRTTLLCLEEMISHLYKNDLDNEKKSSLLEIINQLNQLDQKSINQMNDERTTLITSLIENLKILTSGEQYLKDYVLV
ncbi:unnamed protein product, partial [Didymodactylos carnosus]